VVLWCIGIFAIFYSETSRLICGNDCVKAHAYTGLVASAFGFVAALSLKASGASEYKNYSRAFIAICLIPGYMLLTLCLLFVIFLPLGHGSSWLTELFPAAWR
jgi:hypothetical protein